MAHQVVWTEQVLKNFETKAMLNDDECYIMESRCKGVSVLAQSEHLHTSKSSVERMITKLKIKYDKVQAEFPDEFPPRKASAKETWMDTH